tara:strand:- start:18 stop:1481 length:1464 start_codon:yes stop_codon:yes gene_type:complete
MAESANTTNFKNYFLKNKKLGSIDIDDAIDGSDDVTLIFEKKLTAAQKKSIVEKVNTNLKNNFYGEYKVGTVKTTVNEVINKNTGKFEDEIFNSLKINVTNINFAESNAPTAVQEEGSAFVMTQVIRNNKKFTSPSDILDDKDTNDGLQKIFKSHKNSLKEWTFSYFEHQKAFFKTFQPSQWDEFEHGGQDLMEFIKDQCSKVRTSSGKPVGRYETWNPADIWVVKNKSIVKRRIDEAIKPHTNPPTARLQELNNVLLSLVEENLLIGLSLKKIERNEKAKFKYVNKSPKDIEFADIEKIQMKDISLQMQTNDAANNKGMMLQGAYAVFDDYRINVIRTPGDKFTNLKYESSIKGSGGRGGAAPVELVQVMMKKRGIQFINDHSKYPETSEEFKKDRRDYKKMFTTLKTKMTISGYIDYNKFEKRILEMYDSGDKKSMTVAQSKLMQLDFFYSVLSTPKGRESEFWTDLLYLSLKVGKRFAPHGKLA